MKVEKEQTTIRLPAELKDSLMEEAQRLGVCTSVLLRTLLKQYIKKFRELHRFEIE